MTIKPPQPPVPSTSLPAGPIAPTAPATVTPSTVSRNPHRKMLLIVSLVTIILVATGAIGGFFKAQKPQEKTSSPSLTPSPSQTADWNTYDSALFSFRYPPDLTINNTNNGIYLFEGPTNEKNSDYFFGLTSPDKDSSYEPVFETKVDNKKTLIKAGTVNIKGYPLLNRIETVIENVRFYQEGKWFDNGTMYLFFRINGDTDAARKTAYAILETFKFKAFSDANPAQSATINRLEFKLPVTWWYGCYPAKLYHLCHIDTVSNVRPHRPAQFFLEYFSAGQTVFPLIDMELLTDVKEKTIDISGFSGTLIEGRVDPKKFTEGSSVYIQNDIVRMLEIKTPEGIYIFDGVVTKENLKLSYDQILSTFRFSDSPQTEICYTDPEEALNNFLNFLNLGEYEKAAQIYAATYPFELVDISQDKLTPNEKQKILADFLKNRCEGFGTCLEHKIANSQKVNENEFDYGVYFYDEDGSLYQLYGTPNEEGIINYTTGPFGFKVEKINGCYKNWGTPPMTP